MNVESSSSYSGHSDGVTLATSHLSHLRSDIFYVMREVFIIKMTPILPHSCPLSVLLLSLQLMLLLSGSVCLSPVVWSSFLRSPPVP